MGQEVITPEWVTEQLVKLLKRGAYAEMLRWDAPYLVDLLSPQSDPPDPTRSDRQRAKEAEDVIKAAIEEMATNYEENVQEALWRLFAFREGLGLRGTMRGGKNKPWVKRRRSAGDALGIKPGTFRKDYQRPYLEALAGTLYYRYILRTEQE